MANQREIICNFSSHLKWVEVQCLHRPRVLVLGGDDGAPGVALKKLGGVVEGHLALVQTAHDHTAWPVKTYNWFDMTMT